MALAHVQHPALAHGSAVNTLASTTFASSVTVGNYIVVPITSWVSGSPGVAGVTDNKGNTYTEGPHEIVQGSAYIGIWWTKVTTGGTGLIVTVDCADGSYIAISPGEFSGITASSAVDLSVTSAADDTTSPFNLTSGAKSQNDELIVVVMGTAASGGTYGAQSPPTTGYTALGLEDDCSSYTGHSSAYKIVSGAGTESVAMTFGNEGAATRGVMLSLKAAAGGDVLPVTNGNLTLTGQAVALKPQVTVAQGTLSLTGQDVGLVSSNSTVLAVTAATLSLTGQSIATKPAVTVTQGSLVLAPQSVALISGGSSVLGVTNATLSLTGQEVPCQFSSVWTHGLLTLTGKDASDKVFVTAAALSLTGKQATIGPQIRPNPGALTLVGFDVGLNYNLSSTLSVSHASLGLTGSAVTLFATSGSGSSDRLGQNAVQMLASGGFRETAPEAPVGTTAVKFNPGWGIYSGTQFNAFSTLTSDGNLPSMIAELAAMPNVKLILCGFQWGSMESSEGVYTLDLMQDLLDECEANQVRLVVLFNSTVFSSGSIDFQISSGRFPAYLRDTYNGLVSDGTQVEPKLYDPVIMSKMIGVYQEIAARFDNHPWFEGIMTGESAVSRTAPGYTDAAYLANLKTLYSACETAFAHSAVFAEMNSAFGGDISMQQDLLSYAAAHRMIFSGPDIRPDDFIPGGAGGTQFQRVWLGLDGGIDYSDQIACGFQVQGPNLGGNHTPTAAQLDPTTLLPFIQDIAKNTFQSRYCFLLRKTFGSTSGGTNNDQFWTTAESGYTLYHPTIKEFLQLPANQIALNTDLPPNYPQTTNAVKFNPGWGVQSSYTYSALDTQINSLDITIINDIATMPKVKHFMARFYWGAIDRGNGVYNFDIIDQLLALCQQKGLRFVPQIMWSAISAGSIAYQISQGRFPAYLNQFPDPNPAYPYTGIVASEGQVGIASRVDAQMHRTEIMDAWLDMNRALAAHLDTHPKLEGVTTYDSTPSTLSTKPDPSFNQTVWQASFKRQMVELKDIWQHTNVMMSMDHGFQQDIPQKQAIMQVAEDNRMVMGTIDLQPANYIPGGSGGSNMDRIFRGQDGTKDFSLTMAYGGRTANGDLGGGTTPTASEYPPADTLDVLLLDVLNNIYKARWFFWPYKTGGITAGGNDNDQFWNAAQAGFTLYHPTIKEFLNTYDLTHTTPPANYAGYTIVTGG